MSLERNYIGFASQNTLSYARSYNERAYALLRYMNELVRLQRQKPPRMFLDVFHTLGCDGEVFHGIARITGLQVVQAAVLVVPAWSMNAIEDDLHLIDFLHLQGWRMVDETALRRQRHPVNSFSNGLCTVGFHRKKEAFRLQCTHQRGVDLQRRFAACQHQKAATAPLADCVDNLAGGHLPVRREVGIAERTAKIAAAETHKDGSTPRVPPLTLQGIEDFIDAIHPVTYHFTAGIWHQWGSHRRKPSPCSSATPRQ